MGLSIFLVILLTMIFWYAILPFIGGFYSRYRWRKFRNRFSDLCICPLLDYSQYRQLDNQEGIFRFTGNIESITDGHTLWVRGNDLTIPVSLSKTKCYQLPMHEGDGLPEAPQQIRWNRVSTLTENSKVFIGGQLKMQDNRLNFISTKENPLMVIFYNCPDSELKNTIIRAARTRNEYWNSFTPVSLAVGALILISIAASYLYRPAFRLIVISSFIAVFVPILPVLPPGFVFTVLCRRLTWNARRLRINSDLAHFDLIPGASKKLARRYAIKAYSLEAFAWLLMLLCITINIVFIFLVLYLLEVISL